MISEARREEIFKLLFHAENLPHFFELSRDILELEGDKAKELWYILHEHEQIIFTLYQ